jgi:AbrB family looped-hinge helix DNA binding protein
MITTIDHAGRLVIPKPLRERLKLSAGTRVDIVEIDGAIEIRPAPHPITVDWSGSKPRLQASGHVPPLTADEVRDLLDETRP